MWVLAHNGTIFDSEVLAPYQYLQDGTTDSERILLYIVDKMNKYYKQNGEQPDADQRVRIVDDVIREITPGNKVNLMLCDGELFYVHKNEAGTLYFKETDGSVIFSTQSLGPDGWTETAQNRLLVYKDGELFYAGRPHDHTYIHDEEKMKLLYFEYSGL